MSRRAAIIVLDGLGIGPAHDTDAYGDAGSNTLGNVARAVGGLALPNLEALGLGRCAPVAGLAPPVTRRRVWRLRAGERRQGQHHRALGNLRPDPRRAVSHVSAWVSRRM